MKVKYIGESFGVDSLTNGKIYDCLGVDAGMLRIIDAVSYTHLDVYKRQTL